MIIDEKRNTEVLGEKKRWQVLEQMEVSTELIRHDNDSNLPIGGVPFIRTSEHQQSGSRQP